MKKYVLLGLIFISSTPLQGSGGNNNHYREEFRDKVIEALETSPNKFDGEFNPIIFSFFTYGPFDVDSIFLTADQKQKTKLNTLGELLDDAAELGKHFGISNHICQLHAKIILALVAYDRSRKSIAHDPAEMLRTLILNAIKSPENNQQDWDRQSVLKDYYGAGFFGGTYDIKKIPVHWMGGESIYSYLEREAKTDDRIKMVFDIISFCDIQHPSVQHYGYGNRNVNIKYIYGNVPAHFFIDQINPRVEPVRLGEAPKAKHSNVSPQGTSFFTTPRILMGIGAALIGGFIFYKNYYSQSKDDSDESVNRGVGSVAHA